MDETLLDIEKLYCERDDRVLFESLNFSVKAGEIWRIEGPNGTGKTTLLRILCGLLSHYEGQIRFRGQVIQSVRPLFRANTLYLGHKPGVKASLTAEENLAFLCQVDGSQEQQAIREALAKVGLKGFEDVAAQSLSAGQQRRIALARLYLQQQPLWILDEPFTAIDVHGVAQLEARLEEHAMRGGAVIVTTHHDLKLKSNRLKRLILGGGAQSE